MKLFADGLHQEFATWALGFAPYGAADVGEVVAIADAVEDGDDGSYYEAWTAMAGRLAEEADAAQSKGRRQSACEAYLHASCYYAIAYHPLYGTPVDPRLTAAFKQQIGAFDKAMALRDPPVERLEVPYEQTTMPAYLIRAVGREHETRPLLIAGTGYDATVTETYFATAVAAAARGYHCLFHDGPGQGRLLIEQSIPIRPDWENVVTPLVDFALGLDGVDPGRVAYTSWSLGGYLAPRAASGEHRLAACIADPGIWDFLPQVRGMVLRLGLPQEAAAALPKADEDTLRRLTEAAEGSRELRWRIIKRGFWVGAVSTMADYIRSLAEFTLEGRAEAIRCPTLLTSAERDPLGKGAEALYDRLTCPKQLLRFTAAEGAGEHCEIMNRSLLNRRVFDWLDGVLVA